MSLILIGNSTCLSPLELSTVFSFGMSPNGLKELESSPERWCLTFSGHGKVWLPCCNSSAFDPSWCIPISRQSNNEEIQEYTVYSKLAIAAPELVIYNSEWNMRPNWGAIGHSLHQSHHRRLLLLSHWDTIKKTNTEREREREEGGICFFSEWRRRPSSDDSCSQNPHHLTP